MNFGLNAEQVARLNVWLKEQDTATVKAQMADPKFPKDAFIANLHAHGIPYFGAAGGELTYEFTPTSIGVVEKVTHAGTKQTLDLTEYDTW